MNKSFLFLQKSLSSSNEFYFYRWLCKMAWISEYSRNHRCVWHDALRIWNILASVSMLCVAPDFIYLILLMFCSDSFSIREICTMFSWICLWLYLNWTFSWLRPPGFKVSSMQHSPFWPTMLSCSRAPGTLSTIWVGARNDPLLHDLLIFSETNLQAWRRKPKAQWWTCDICWMVEWSKAEMEAALNKMIAVTESVGSTCKSFFTILKRIWD